VHGGAKGGEPAAEVGDHLIGAKNSDRARGLGGEMVSESPRRVDGSRWQNRAFVCVR